VAHAGDEAAEGLGGATAGLGCRLVVSARGTSGRRQACFARHELAARILGQPLCLDCYDYPAHVVLNLHVGELWRRTRIAIERLLKRRARSHGIDPNTIRIQYG
jgi:hypothetical protein